MGKQADIPGEYSSNQKKQTVYLCGQVTGLKTPAAYAQFRAKQLELEERGFKVLNRCEVTPVNLLPDKAPRIGLGLLLTAEFICLLPGWNRCDQAKTEMAVALKLNMPSIDD